MNEMIVTIGSLIGGASLIYAAWYLINSQRSAEHLIFYNKKSAICLAIGSMIISGSFLFALLSRNLGEDPIRMSVAAIGLIFLLLSMHYNENESIP